MADRGVYIHVIVDKSCYVPFHETYDHQIWKPATSRGADSFKTNLAGAGDVVVLISHDFEKNI